MNSSIHPVDGTKNGGLSFIGNLINVMVLNLGERSIRLLKLERFKRKVYTTPDEARSNVSDCIEIFYKSKRKHGSNNLLPPVEYENRYQELLGSF